MKKFSEYIYLILRYVIYYINMILKLRKPFMIMIKYLTLIHIIITIYTSSFLNQNMKLMHAACT